MQSGTPVALLKRHISCIRISSTPTTRWARQIDSSRRMILFCRILNIYLITQLERKPSLELVFSRFLIIRNGRFLFASSSEPTVGASFEVGILSTLYALRTVSFGSFGFACVSHNLGSLSLYESSPCFLGEEGGGRKNVCYHILSLALRSTYNLGWRASNLQIASHLSCCARCLSIPRDLGQMMGSLRHQTERCPN